MKRYRWMVCLLCTMAKSEELRNWVMGNVVQVARNGGFVAQALRQPERKELIRCRGDELRRLAKLIENVAHDGNGSTPCRPLGMRSSLPRTSSRRLMKVSG